MTTAKAFTTFEKRFDYLINIPTDAFWYLASPYSSHPDGQVEAFTQVCNIAGILMAGGVRLFCPISHTHPVEVHGHLRPENPRYSHEFWMAVDRPFMVHAHGILIAAMPGYDKSRGMAEELEFFKKANKPGYWLDPEELEAYDNRRLRG